MEISAEKTKLMTNSANGIQKEIKVKGQTLGTVISFKYLGAVVSDDGSKPKVLSRIARATAALTKMKPIWGDNNISLGSKVKLMRSLVISIFLYACESWTAQLGQLKIGQDGQGFLRIHLWCPDDLQMSWNRIENQSSTNELYEISAKYTKWLWRKD